MKLHEKILAGTALGLLVGASPAAAFPPRADDAPLVLAQAGEPAPEPREERKPRREAPAEKAPEAPAPQAAEPAPPPPAEPAPAAAEKAAEPPPAAAPEAPPPDPEPRKAEQPPAEPEPRRAEEPRQDRNAAEAPADAAPAENPSRREEPAKAEQAAPAEAGEPAKSAREQRREERRQQREERRQDREEAEAPAAPREPAQQPAEPPARAEGEQPAQPEPEQEQARPAPQTPDGGETPAEQRAEPGAPDPQATEPGRREAGETPSDGDAPRTGEAPASPPAEGEAATGEAAPENAAPVLDSAKETAPEGRPRERREQAGEGGQTPADGEPRTAQPAAPPPTDDAAAQGDGARPEKVESATAEEGKRIERGEDRRERRERPDGAEIVREIGDRVIIQIDNRTIVESSDRPRMARDAREVYYEELPRGRQREVIVRPNGSQIVTIRNRYGDVVRRSRIAPDGAEVVLVYVDERDYERVRDWRDPGDDLPPLQLAIPASEYILDAERVDDPDAYYAFLDQPPVEQVQRLYSVDEVKRSARIRDTVRRVDLDTITFEFGSASIAESEVERLEGVAQAMERLLQENPGETFLIEGHTDAVGSANANLALSDRRAESVAEALTSVFAIPPENLATQGYGETYLKVASEEPERENRRVAIRRITPLVAPVASAD